MIARMKNALNVSAALILVAGVGSDHAVTIGCDLGSIPDHGFREVVVSTTLPSDGSPGRFGVFTYSGTPDPVPGNNYAARVVP
jgi:hypothetical protein